MGQTGPEKVPDVIKAHSVVIVDEAGVGRATLAAGSKGTGLILTDPNGKLRAVLSAAPNGAGLQLTDGDGYTRIMALVGSNANGVSSITLSDKDGKAIWKAP